TCPRVWRGEPPVPGLRRGDRLAGRRRDGRRCGNRGARSAWSTGRNPVTTTARTGSGDGSLRSVPANAATPVRRTGPDRAGIAGRGTGRGQGPVPGRAHGRDGVRPAGA